MTVGDKKEESLFDIPLKQKIKVAINYWRFRLCSHGGVKVTIAWYWHLFAPIGLLIHIRDKCVE